MVNSVGGCSSDKDRLHALLYFLGKNSEEGVSEASLSSKMAGLTFLFKLGGIEDVIKAFILKEGRFCFSPFEVQLFRTTFNLAFFFSGHYEWVNW